MPRIEPLYDAPTIAHRVEALAQAIAASSGPALTLIALLRGSFIFTADLIRALHTKGIELRVDFMVLGSYYSGQQSSGAVMLHHAVMDDIVGHDVLLLDDILESGRTLCAAKELLLRRGAQRVRTAVLLEKPGKRKADVEADFVGFTIEDRFVVGYGLDAAHRYRELPYIGVFS